MKKLFPFVLVLILCFSLAGCGGTEKKIRYNIFRKFKKVGAKV